MTEVELARIVGQFEATLKAMQESVTRIEKATSSTDDNLKVSLEKLDTRVRALEIGIVKPTIVAGLIAGILSSVVVAFVINFFKFK